MGTNSTSDKRVVALQPFLALEEILDTSAEDIFGDPSRGWVILDDLLAARAAQG